MPGPHASPPGPTEARGLSSGFTGSAGRKQITEADGHSAVFMLFGLGKASPAPHGRRPSLPRDPSCHRAGLWEGPPRQPQRGPRCPVIFPPAVSTAGLLLPFPLVPSGLRTLPAVHDRTPLSSVEPRLLIASSCEPEAWSPLNGQPLSPRHLLSGLGPPSSHLGTPRGRENVSPEAVC